MIHGGTDPGASLGNTWPPGQLEPSRAPGSPGLGAVPDPQALSPGRGLQREERGEQSGDTVGMLKQRVTKAKRPQSVPAGAAEQKLGATGRDFTLA